MVGYNNKVLIYNTDMKIDSNKDVNKVHKKSSANPPDPDRVEDAAHAAPKTHLRKGTDKSIKEKNNQRMLAEKHNDETLAITILIVGAGLVAFHF